MNKKRNNKVLKIVPLGGLREVGKNMTAFEYGDDIIIIDCGLSFPTSEMYGVDAVIPSFDYVDANLDKIKGIIVTHAHEDHIGALPYLLTEYDIPIYGSALSIGFLQMKLKERHIDYARLYVIESDASYSIGQFMIEALHMTHSVADSFSLAIHTPIGTIFHTGDFKVDYTPVDEHPIDLSRLASIGDEGVLLLLADSTNAHKEGYSRSESAVRNSLRNIFMENSGRIIITAFSSHIHRVQTIIDLSVDTGRKVAVTGRSMENMIKIATELGYLHIPANTLLTMKQSKQYKPSELVILTTGTQGEQNSALTRIVNGQHKDVKLLRDDAVILSSSIIPGNEVLVSNIINAVMERGAKIIYNEIAETHSSGHAYQEELKLMHALLRPKFFMPIHGEIKQLVSHADIAKSMGMPEENIIIASNGDVIELTKNNVKKTSEHVNADPVLVDGTGIGDVGNLVLNERRALSNSGVVVLSAVFDTNGDVISGPEIKTKGLVYVKEYGDLLKDAVEVLNDSIDNAMIRGDNREAIEKIMIDTLRSYFYKNISRSPVIVPMFMEV